MSYIERDAPVKGNYVQLLDADDMPSSTKLSRSSLSGPIAFLVHLCL
jgi:hypothetical protein